MNLLQGLSCSRCDTFADCPGCILEGEERIVFRPGDHLTVQFDDISQDLVNKVDLYFIIVAVFSYFCLEILQYSNSPQKSTAYVISRRVEKGMFFAFRYLLISTI